MYSTHGYASVGTDFSATVAKVGHPAQRSALSDLRQNENNDVTNNWYLGSRPLTRTVRVKVPLILNLDAAESSLALYSRGYGRQSAGEVADMQKRFSPSQESKPGRQTCRKLPC